MRTLVIVLIIFSLVIFAEGHNWLITPASRNGNQAQTTAPCENSDTAPVTTVQLQGKGASVSSSWSTNHAGTHEIWVFPHSLEATIETMTPTSPGITHYSSYPIATASSMISIPGSTSPGNYTLQYRWTTWRNCANLKVMAAPPSGASATGQPGIFKITGGTFNANTGKVTCNSGYKPSGNHCVMKAMNSAAAFFLAVFIILIVVVLVLVGFVIARRAGVLPPKVASVVEKGEMKTVGAAKWIGSKFSKSPTTSPSKTETANVPVSTTPRPQSSPPMSQPPPRAAPPRPVKLQVGDQVQAQYSGDGKYYGADIVDMQQGKVLVRYSEFGGQQEWIPTTAVQK